jgi:8-oxo-dGTP pyrophosphatase MutT (NUDIX family)
MSGPPKNTPSGERNFCRFATGGSRARGTWDLPPDGLCLSSFVLLSPREHPERVLVGRLNSGAPWGQIGALDERRIHLNANGWMLPSSHLLYFESPRAAAERVVAEQLGIGPLKFGPPEIFSETYRSPRHPEEAEHWDLEFLFRGQLDAETAPKHPAWTELAFVDPARTPRREFTRSHDEVLENAGFRIEG